MDMLGWCHDAMLEWLCILDQCLVNVAALWYTCCLWMFECKCHVRWMIGFVP